MVSESIHLPPCISANFDKVTTLSESAVSLSTLFFIRSQWYCDIRIGNSGKAKYNTFFFLININFFWIGLRLGKYESFLYWYQWKSLYLDTSMKHVSSKRLEKLKIRIDGNVSSVESQGYIAHILFFVNTLLKIVLKIYQVMFNINKLLFFGVCIKDRKNNLYC